MYAILCRNGEKYRLTCQIQWDVITLVKLTYDLSVIQKLFVV